MTTSFRTPTTVIHRTPGAWRDGFYYPADDDGEWFSLPLTIQMPSAGDRQLIDALPLGRRASRMIKVYSDVRLEVVSQEPQGVPGDLIVHDGSRFLVIGEADFTTLRRTRRNTVSHWRYFAAEMIEHTDRERVP